MKVYKKKELVQYVTIRAMFFHGYVQGITCVSEPLTILKDLKLRQKQEGRPTCMLFSELLKNPCLHRPWPPRVMWWYVMGYLETSEYLLSGGGGGGRWEGFGGVTWFSVEKKGGGWIVANRIRWLGGGTIGTNWPPINCQWGEGGRVIIRIFQGGIIKLFRATTKIPTPLPSGDK